MYLLQHQTNSYLIKILNILKFEQFNAKQVLWTLMYTF